MSRSSCSSALSALTPAICRDDKCVVLIAASEDQHLVAASEKWSVPASPRSGEEKRTLPVERLHLKIDQCPILPGQLRRIGHRPLFGRAERADGAAGQSRGAHWRHPARAGLARLSLSSVCDEQILLLIAHVIVHIRVFGRRQVCRAHRGQVRRKARGGDGVSGRSRRRGSGRQRRPRRPRWSRCGHRPWGRSGGRSSGPAPTERS